MQNNCSQLSSTASRYFRNGSPGFLSPSLLDPSLLPISIEAAYKTYQMNQVHIVQLKANNETFMCNAIAKYGPYLPQGQISPSMLPPVTGQQARPFHSVHNGYVHHEQNGYPSPSIPRPPPYQSPLQHGTTFDSQQGRPFHQQGKGYPACTTQVDSDERPTRDEQYLTRSNGRESSGANRNVSRNQPGSGGGMGQIVEYDEEEITPKKKVSFRRISKLRRIPLTGNEESVQSQRRKERAMVRRSARSCKPTKCSHQRRSNASWPELGRKQRGCPEAEEST